jgi:hypothetical protein
MLVATFVVDDLKWPVSDHQSSGQQQRSLLTTLSRHAFTVVRHARLRGCR